VSDCEELVGVTHRRWLEIKLFMCYSRLWMGWRWSI